MEESAHTNKCEGKEKNERVDDSRLTMRAVKIYLIGLAKRTVDKGLNVFGYEIRKKEREVEITGQTGLNLARNIKRIHYACGFRMLEGWLNVDADLVLKTQPGFTCLSVNLVGPHPFPDNWFEYGFCEDFLEHLNQSDSIIFLSEVYRTFKEGGVIRLSFPGMEGVLKRHYSDQTFEGYVKGKTEAYTMWEHIHFYSKEELALVCRHIGFRDIKFVEYGESVHSPLKGHDYREDQIGLNTYVELTK